MRKGLGLIAAIAVAAWQGCEAQSLQELRNLSIEELGRIEVTSVSKRPEPLLDAPAAVYVITAEEIRRSGAATLAEALRLAPNLEVARVNSRDYAISARGFNSVNASNKLLVLIDGRSVYTPLFSSVFWDQQQVMLADVDRIEVVSGPGGTLWGANAVNGVINVITRSPRDTPGGLVDAHYGTFERGAAARWGGPLGPDGSARGYAQGFGQGHTYLPSTDSAHDDWYGKQAGFRTDMSAAGNGLTFQGDIYENLLDAPGGRRSGGNVLGRWSRTLSADSFVQLQGYYDQQNRWDVSGGGGTQYDNVKTFDLEGTHSFRLSDAHELVWGFGERIWQDRFNSTTSPFNLVPESQTITLTNLFGQDTIRLRPQLDATLGTKVEYSSFSGWELMPSGRLGWRVSPDDLLWTAVSRSVRPPSRLDRDITAPGIVDTAPSFRSEKVVAYEMGWRAQPSRRATMSVSLFYNRYTDLRSLSPAPTGTFPAQLHNGLQGYTYGAELWGSYSPFEWWRLTAGFDVLKKRLALKAGETDLSGYQTSGGLDPGHQIFLRSYMDLPWNTELYIALREIGSLEDGFNQYVPSYFEADMRLGWHVLRNVELALTGLNLVHAFHAEAFGPPAQKIPRSVYASVRWSF